MDSCRGLEEEGITSIEMMALSLIEDQSGGFERVWTLGIFVAHPPHSSTLA